MGLPLRFVVAGTGTGVGKTVVSALLVRGLTARYWKPVQAGLPEITGEPTDSQRVQQLTGCAAADVEPEAYRLRQPASPHWAAEQEGMVLDRERLWPPEGNDPLVVELAGGLLVPLGKHLLQIDVVGEWGLPVVLVAAAGLGTLNHTLLSLEALRKRRIPVLGLVLNGTPFADNAAVLQELGRTRLLGQLPPLSALETSTLDQAWRDSGLQHWWDGSPSF